MRHKSSQALFTRLATQIVYGGCDHDTADFYSGVLLTLFIFTFVHYRRGDGDIGGDCPPGIWADKIALF